jgi:hypothetical protein
MEKVSIIGLDLAKRSFQAHGARAEGGVAFRKKLSRAKVLISLLSNRAASSPWRPAGALIIGGEQSATSDTKFG